MPLRHPKYGKGYTGPIQPDCYNSNMLIVRNLIINYSTCVFEPSLPFTPFRGGLISGYNRAFFDKKL